MNGAVSKVNKKFISHLTRAQRTPSAAATVQVSHACVFSKPCTKLTLHCNHRSGHLKTEHTESLFLLRRHLGNWPRSTAVSTSERTAGSAWETWTVAAADGVRCARVRWEINFLLTFEIAPFICKHPVHKCMSESACSALFIWLNLSFSIKCRIYSKFLLKSE